MICCLHAYVVGVNFHKLKFKIVNLDRNGRSGNSGMGSWPLHLHAVSHVACTTNNVCSEVIECRILQLVKVFGVFNFFPFSFLLCRNLFTNLQSSNILKNLEQSNTTPVYHYALFLSFQLLNF